MTNIEFVARRSSGTLGEKLQKKYGDAASAFKEADADVEADREEQRARAAGGSAAGAKQGPVVEDLRPVDFGAPDCDFSGFETLGTHHMRPSFAHRDSLP